MKTKTNKIMNPVGVNQYLLDPRQKLCWDNYINPKSPTFSNATQSAVKAGYSLLTSKQITNEIWFRNRTLKMSMLTKAERNIDEALDLPTFTQAIGPFGPIVDKKTKKPVMAYNKGLLAIKNDMTKFVAERLGKKRYGKKEDEGGDTYNVVIFANESKQRIARRIIEGGSVDSTAGEGKSD